jgi:hypothetical protein
LETRDVGKHAREGDPPRTAVGFFEFLESSKAPQLAHVRFAVLALGDSTYRCSRGSTPFANTDRRPMLDGLPELARALQRLILPSTADMSRDPRLSLPRGRRAAALARSLGAVSNRSPGFTAQWPLVCARKRR